MDSTGFPTDDYTPHGYLANPFAVAHSWTEGQGGCLRTCREHLGLGWQLPWAQGAQASVELVIEVERRGQRFRRRADFASAGLVSPHHSSRLFEYRWEMLGRRWEAKYALIDRETLGLAVIWTPLTGTGDDGLQETCLTIRIVGSRQSDVAKRVNNGIDLDAPYGRWELLRDGIDVGTTARGSTCALIRPVSAHRRGADSRDVVRLVGDALTRAYEDDHTFWSGATRLEGDWPASWRRGWVYDVETTRMCVYPAGGIFRDVWPAWMVQWPRAVVAEGTLDMARLAYASPDLAQRATLSLFRDAEAPNVPCVFQHGEPNMVAADGSICGTSPAWCVPFYNLERLFALTLDREWLAEIYPYLKRYVEWWLAERTDADGWAVYKCTWEAGEDDTPRLDPERRGDNVVSAFVRPVELQATMALSAGVLARFAAVLGKRDDQRTWGEIEAAYLMRTRELWDPAEGRFRDWDARNDRFLETDGGSNYWGIDPCRLSALAFTPLLAGLTDHAYQDGLRQELRHYDGPPWTLWASWSYVVLEAARRTGDHQFAGRVAAEIVGRVYEELDARDPGGPNHPTPGVAREYWPLDLDTWASCEGYGWGANTASLLVRQIFGFIEGPYVDLSNPDASNGSAAPRQVARAAEAVGWRAPVLAFELRPSLPADFLIPGREYWLVNVPYRGARLSLGYRVPDIALPDGADPDVLTILVRTNIPTRCRITEISTQQDQNSDVDQNRHEIGAHNGGVYLVELSPGS